MNFREALSQILQSKSAEFAGDPFWLYSCLSDLCKSYIDRQKISLLFEVDRRLHIVLAVMTEGEVAQVVLEKAYPAVKNILTAESYKKLLTCVTEAAFPTDNKEPQPAAGKVKVAAIQREEEEENEEPRTLLYHKPNYSLRWIIGIAAGLLVIAGIVCLCIFGKYINWNGWQHIIGSIGGPILFVALCLLAVYLDVNMVLDFYISGAIIIPIVAVVNFLLYLFLRENYKVIFIWLSVYAILVGILSSILYFNDFEEGWGILQIIETAIVIAGLILGLIFL